MLKSFVEGLGPPGVATVLIQSDVSDTRCISSILQRPYSMLDQKLKQSLVPRMAVAIYQISGIRRAPPVNQRPHGRILHEQ